MKYKKMLVLFLCLAIPLLFSLLYSYIDRQGNIMMVNNDNPNNEYIRLFPFFFRILTGLLAGIFYCIMYIVIEKINIYYTKGFVITISALAIYPICYAIILFCLVNHIPTRYSIAQILLFSGYVIALIIFVLFRKLRTTR